jgi:hypothetical protein
MFDTSSIITVSKREVLTEKSPLMLVRIETCAYGQDYLFKEIVVEEFIQFVNWQERRYYLPSPISKSCDCSFTIFPDDCTILRKHV